MTATLRTKSGNAAGLAGQWMQFVLCGWVAFSQGSYLFSSLYLLSVAAPSVLPFPKIRSLGLLAPAGVVWLSLVDASLPILVATGLAVGIGAAVSGRPLALSSGFTGGPGWAGAAGAAACIFLPNILGIQSSLWVVAGLLAFAVWAGESHDRRGPLPSALLPAAAVLAGVAGLRVLEPGFDSGLRGFAAFATAWAIGAQTGWKASPSADARAVLAAPFLGAMALTGLGSVKGPGLIFLYGFLAACCAVVGGSGLPQPVDKMPVNRRALLVGVAAGALWANAPYDFQVLAWWTSGTMIVGGFASSITARRMRAPRAEPEFETPIIERIAPSETQEVTAPLEAEPVLDERHVLELLLDATRTANKIRREALLELQQARADQAVLPSARQRAASALSELLDELAALRRRLESR